jgi:Zn-dependent protease with chaperone function
MNTVEGYWYPAGRGQRHDVVVSLNDDGCLLIATDPASERPMTWGLVREIVNVSEIKVSDRLAKIPRFLHLSNGSTLELQANNAIDRFLDRAVPDSVAHSAANAVHRFESRWVYAIAALFLVIVGIVGFLRYALPPIAAQIALLVPTDVEEAIGAEVLGHLDTDYFDDSRLSQSRQSEIRSIFNQLVENVDLDYRYQLNFRSGVGPNAFALPGGQVVVTDEFVELAHNNEEILAVLAHEVGHVEGQHVLRRLIKYAASVVVLVTVLDDVTAISGLAISAPAFMMSMQHSRSHETDADRFAVNYMNAHGRDPMALASILTRLTGDISEDSLSNYFLTHPGLERRIENIESFSK